jgi:hypothetical protein
MLFLVGRAVSHQSTLQNSGYEGISVFRGSAREYIGDALKLSPLKITRDVPRQEHASDAYAAMTLLLCRFRMVQNTFPPCARRSL